MRGAERAGVITLEAKAVLVHHTGVAGFALP
jgi:hypothetical protein